MVSEISKWSGGVIAMLFAMDQPRAGRIGGPVGERVPSSRKGLGRLTV